MGDLFKQRRAAKSQQKPSSSNPPSFLDIQAEQDRERSKGYIRGADSFRNDRRGGDSGSFRNDRRRNRRDRSDLPLEQGSIASLKDAFGFIYCADRPDEIFFHFSELNGCHSDDLQIDDEVEFRVGPSRDNDKMAAFEVKKLERGTIEWEVEEDPGARFQGLVERPMRSERASLQLSEGTIRMLVPHEEQTTEEEIAAAATGPLIRYSAADYTPEENEVDTMEFRRLDSSVSNSSRGGGGRARLAKNDLVEFTLVTERRTGNKMARSITLLQSERERQRLAREKELMANATLEKGVVTSLKTDYGFLRSNRRREEIYFHYSNVDLPDDDDEANEKNEHFVLEEGQDMEFLVLAEPGGEGQRDKLSAREVKFLPKGSVIFQTLVAEGVTGVVTRPPHPQDAGYSSGMVGRVQLSEPLEDTDDDGNVSIVDQVLFYSKDSPGGTFLANRDGTSVGIWVREGDTLLFDVVKDVVDGKLRVGPTKHAQPTAVESPSESKDEDKEVDETTSANKKAVRLIAASLAGRAEGVVHAIKEGYGFISCAERPVDAYFRLYELMPDHMQDDLRRNMGIETGDDVPQLKVGAQVEFDLSLQGIVAVGNHRSRNRLGGSSERENLKGQRLLILPESTFMESKVIAKDAKGVISKEDEKQNYAGFVEFEETYKPMSYEERHPLVAKLIHSLLQDDSPKQCSVVYHDVQSLQEDDVVVNMVEEIGKGSLTCTHIPVAGHPGRLCITKVDAAAAEDIADGPSSGAEVSDKPAFPATGVPAAYTVETLTGDDIVQSTSSSLEQSSHSKRGKKKKKRPKVKDIKVVHYDKHCLSKESMEDIPPGIGDVVLCDIMQSRRTGLVEVTNIRVTERSEAERSDVSGEGAPKTSGVGMITEVVGASKFGFISLLEENASRREMLFFQFSSIVDALKPENSMASSLHSNSKHSRGGSPVKTGDEVKFDIVVGKKGKRTAINIHVVPRGTLNIPTRADKNACRGLILMEPSHTSLSNTPARQASRTPVVKGNGRWDNVDSDNLSKISGVLAKEEGRILLVNDPSNMFAFRKATKKDIEETYEPDSSDTHGEFDPATKGEPDEDANGNGKKDLTLQSAVGTLVSYKNGAIAIHGAGASSVADGSNAPRRGDLVSFVKAKSGRGVRDIRVVERGAATLQRGRLEEIKLTPDKESSSPGTAKFIASTEKEEEFDIDLAEVVSCDVTILKDKESVEGILHDGKIYGICRTSDLYLGSKVGSHKERPKLNLTVRKELKKNLGGKIMAQSMMAKVRAWWCLGSIIFHAC